MELLAKYLQDVRSYLPREQQDDILKELSDNILSQLEDKEAELGRPLTAVEQEAIIKQHGNPITVAGRYQLDTRSVAFGRQLIGPVLYPFYIRVLGIALGVSSLAHVAIANALYAAGQSITVDGVIWSIIVHLTVLFGIATLVFTVAQTNMTKFPDRWGPVEQAFDLPAAAGKAENPRIAAFAEFVILLVVFLWLLNVEVSQIPDRGAGSLGLTLAPIWGTLYIPALLLTFAGMVRSALVVVRPDWSRLRRRINVLLDVSSLLLVGAACTAGEWIVFTNPAAASPADLQGMAAINTFVFWGLVSTLIVCAGITLFDAYKLLRVQQRFTTQRA